MVVRIQQYTPAQLERLGQRTGAARLDDFELQPRQRSVAGGRPGLADAGTDHAQPVTLRPGLEHRPVRVGRKDVASRGAFPQRPDRARVEAHGELVAGQVVQVPGVDLQLQALARIEQVAAVEERTHFQDGLPVVATHRRLVHRWRAEALAVAEVGGCHRQVGSADHVVVVDVGTRVEVRGRRIGAPGGDDDVDVVLVDLVVLARVAGDQLVATRRAWQQGGRIAAQVGAKQPRDVGPDREVVAVAHREGVGAPTHVARVLDRQHVAAGRNAEDHQFAVRRRRHLDRVGGRRQIVVEGPEVGVEQIDRAAGAPQVHVEQGAVIVVAQRGLAPLKLDNRREPAAPHAPKVGILNGQGLTVIQRVGLAHQTQNRPGLPTGEGYVWGGSQGRQRHQLEAGERIRLRRGADQLADERRLREPQPVVDGVEGILDRRRAREDATVVDERLRAAFRALVDESEARIVQLDHHLHEVDRVRIVHHHVERDGVADRHGLIGGAQADVGQGTGAVEFQHRGALVQGRCRVVTEGWIGADGGVDVVGRTCRPE